MHAMDGSGCRLINACAFFLGALLLVQESGAGNVLEFDGINDRVLVPYDDSFPTEVFTLSAWIKLTPPGHRSAIIARGEDDDSFNLSWQLYVNPDGLLQIMLENRREQNFCYPLTFSGQAQSSCACGTSIPVGSRLDRPRLPPSVSSRVSAWPSRTARTSGAPHFFRFP